MNNVLDNVVNGVGTISIAIIIVVVLGGLLALPVMWLWNGCLVPAIPAIVEVGWLQSWGLMILSSLLVKSTTTVNT